MAQGLHYTLHMKPSSTSSSSHAAQPAQATLASVSAAVTQASASVHARRRQARATDQRASAGSANAGPWGRGAKTATRANASILSSSDIRQSTSESTMQQQHFARIGRQTPANPRATRSTQGKVVSLRSTVREERHPNAVTAPPVHRGSMAPLPWRGFWNSLGTAALMALPGARRDAAPVADGREPDPEGWLEIFQTLRRANVEPGEN